ncbi:MAG: ATP-binding protein [Spirochaetota bacterium]
MKRSLFIRIFAGFLTIIALMSVITILALRTVRDSGRASAGRELYDLAKSVEAAVLPYAMRGDALGIERYIRPLARTLNKRITVIALNGVVMADSDHDPKTMENHADRPEIVAAQTYRSGESERRSVTLKESMLYLAVTASVDGQPVCFIRTSMRAKTFEDTMRRALLVIGIAAAVGIAAAILFAVVVSRTLGHPLAVVSEASSRVASGDLNARAYVSETSAFKPLADNFNSMVASLKGLIDELSARKDELATVFAAIEEAVVLIDAKGTIVIANDAFRSVAGVASTGRTYWDVLPEDGFLTVVRSAKSGEFVHREMRMAERTFAVASRALLSRGYILVMLRDVSMERDIERLKRDLVSNVSHELRTPLTSIKGYAETLADELSGDARLKFVDIIRKNAERLANIVRDLLVLSDLERETPSLDRERMDMTEIVKDVLSIFEKRALEKGLTITLDAPAPVVILCDRFKLEQLVINLVDNAVKYTEQGGIAVRISGGDTAAVRIEDTGIGIPAEDVPHIFERFYVVDKSRSREAGGTGLGLSIVKHIVHLHNGDIAVQSVVGKGTTFTVTIPAG